LAFGNWQLATGNWQAILLMQAQTRDYRQLEVWQLAHELTLDLYRYTADFPDDERYGLISQLRRASASIPSNIAEGCGRGGEKELARFLRNARGSASEVEYQVHLCHDLGYLSRDQALTLYKQVRSIGKMLTSYITKLSIPHE
jgi:four helix bundle protein